MFSASITTSPFDPPDWMNAPVPPPPLALTLALVLETGESTVPSFTVSVTVYVPDATYAWLGLAPLPNDPSPKSQL